MVSRGNVALTCRGFPDWLALIQAGLNPRRRPVGQAVEPRKVFPYTRCKKCLANGLRPFSYSSDTPGRPTPLPSPDRFRVRRLRPASAIEYFMRIDACLFITFYGSRAPGRRSGSVVFEPNSQRQSAGDSYAHTHRRDTRFAPPSDCRPPSRPWARVSWNPEFPWHRNHALPVTGYHHGYF